MYDLPYVLILFFVFEHPKRFLTINIMQITVYPQTIIFLFTITSVLTSQLQTINSTTNRV